MYADFVKLLNMSAAASILIAVVILLRLLLRKAPKKYICLLWAIAALRLIVPVSISSSVSAYNYIGSQSQVGGQIQYIQYNEKSEKPMGELPVFSGADTAAGEVRRPDFYLPTAMGIWAAGFAAMLGYAAISYLRLCKQTEEAVRYQGRIYRCDHLPSPFILGIIMPKIYLPSELNEPQRQSVIAHEQAHIRRLDHLWKPMGYLILSIHWFNPLVWVGYGLLSRDIESACDERVISKMTNKQKQNYSETLLQCSMPQKFISACPLAFGETGVKQRIKGILNYRKPTAWIVVLSLMICLCSAAAFLTDPVQAETPPAATAHITSDILYELRIGAENVTKIGIEYPGGSGACTNPDGSAFKYGDRIILEPMNDLPDPADVTLRAYTADGELVWERTIRDTEKQADVYNDGAWMLIKLTKAPDNTPAQIISKDAVDTYFGNMTYRLPLKYSYYGDRGTALIAHGNQVLGGLSQYTKETQPRLTDMSWLNDIPFPEWSKNGIYYRAEGLSDDTYTVTFYNNVDETEDGAMRTIHNLFYVDGLLYDLWFDDLKMDAEAQREILETVAFKKTLEGGYTTYSASDGEVLTLYSSPSEAARVLGELTAGEVLTVMRTEIVSGDIWAYGTSENGVTGWVKTDDEISAEATHAASETEQEAHDITIYSSPSKNARGIAILPAGEEFTIIRAEIIAGRTWNYVSSEKQSVIGWMLLDEEVPGHSSDENKISVHSAPSDNSRVIAAFPEEEELTVLREESIAGRTWNYVTNHDETIIGWVKLENEGSSAIPQIAPGSKGTVNIGGDTMLNVRSAPGFMNPSVASIKSGEVVTILETELSENVLWGRIGDNEWICMTYVTMLDEGAQPEAYHSLGMGGVNNNGGDMVNVRKNPGLKSEVVGRLKAGANVNVQETTVADGLLWGRIGEDQWVCMTYVTMFDAMDATMPVAEATAYSDDTIIVYSSPSVQARVIGTLQPDDGFDVIRSENVAGSEWQYISCGDRMGWIKAEQASSGAVHHEDAHNNHH